MTYHPELPWPEIHEYLLGVGTTEHPQTLCQQAVIELKRLIPFDTAYVLFFDDHFQVTGHKVFGVPEETIRQFMDYYITIDPCRQRTASDAKTWRLNWNEFKDTEFQTDFGRHADIFFTSSMYLHKKSGLPGAILFTTRSGQHGFSDRDYAIWEVIQPHLSNLFSITEKLSEVHSEKQEVRLTLPGSYQSPINFHPIELSHGSKLLSKREAEVAALLCQRLTVPEIATKLMISPHTVRTHMDNIKDKLNVRNRRQLLMKFIQDKEK